MAGTTKQGPAGTPTVIKPVRHESCNARLFDARVHWHECSVRDALIYLKCWRCNQIVFLAPEQ